MVMYAVIYEHVQRCAQPILTPAYNEYDALREVANVIAVLDRLRTAYSFFG
jgi:hypothetical protein